MSVSSLPAGGLAGLKRRLRRWRRELSASAHALPDFIIVGAQKGGTTSLYSYLSRHPQVLKASRKEVHYFDVVYGCGGSWYRSHFPRRSEIRERARRLGKPVLTGESSPYYLYHPLVPERVARDLPGAKLVVLLRDPVSRAYSHYHHEVRLGHETLSFEEALRREPERLRGAEAQLRADPALLHESHQHHSYATRGLYAEQIERWLARFPRERVLIQKSEDFFADEQQCFDEVCRFLEIGPMGLGNPKAKNAGSYSQAIPQGAELRAFFERPNRRLYELLGRDFGW